MNALDRSSRNPWADLLTLFGLLLLCTIAVMPILVLIAWISGKDLNEIVNVLDDPAGGITYFSYLTLASGSIGTFFLPAYFFQKRNPHAILFPKGNLTNWKIYVMPLLFLIAFMPLMNIIGEWNMNMKFSEAFSGIEKWMREQEDANMRILSKTIMTTSWSKLALNVLIIGVFAGVCEEFFFRGALQNIVKRMVSNEYLAIWIVAFIFSAIHFQFFGFFPRFILGIVFGYIVVWTKNIWAAVLAHFINNSSVVLVAFYYARQGKGYDALMEIDSYPIITYLGSLVFSALIGIAFYQYIIKRSYMEKGWVKIATYANELTGEMVKLSLEQQGILAVLMNKQDSSLKFGKIELFVQESDAAVAQEIIASDNSEQINED